MRCGAVRSGGALVESTAPATAYSRAAGALQTAIERATTEEIGAASTRQYAASHRAAFRRFSQSRHSTASIVSIATFVPSQFPQK